MRGGIAPRAPRIQPPPPGKGKTAPSRSANVASFRAPPWPRPRTASRRPQARHRNQGLGGERAAEGFVDVFPYDRELRHVVIDYEDIDLRHLRRVRSGPLEREPQVRESLLDLAFEIRRERAACVGASLPRDIGDTAAARCDHHLAIAVRLGIVEALGFKDRQGHARFLRRYAARSKGGEHRGRDQVALFHLSLRNTSESRIS
jgi:hypothetical protein